MATLIRHGHSEKEVLGYSLGKLQLYIKAAARLEVGGRVSELMDTVCAISSSLSGKGLKDYVEEITEVLGDDE